MKPNRIVLQLFLLCALTGCMAKPAQPQQTAQADLPVEGAARARLVFDHEGYFQLSARQMGEAGLQVGAPDQISLNCQGQPQPFWVIPQADSNDFSIAFYVPPASVHFSTQPVMILNTNADPGQSRILAPTELPSQSSASGTRRAVEVTQYELDELYLPKAGLEDPFLWAQIMPDPLFTFALPFDGPDIGDVLLRLHFWSPTSAPQDKDHGVAVRVSGSDLGVFEWKGAGFYELELPIPQPLIAPSLTLELAARIPVGVIAQLLYLDHIEIQYTHELALGGESFSALGDGTIFDFGLSAESGFLAERDLSGGLVSYLKLPPGRQVLLQTKPQFRYDWLPQFAAPDHFALTALPELEPILPDQPIDWLVIASPQFSAALQPLVDHRSAQGLTPWIVDPQRIYDEFYGGYPHPQALNRCLTALKSAAAGLPKYVLLVGDYSYEKLDYDASLQYIPAAWVPSAIIGETVSDMPLMDLDGDSLPQLAIGRLPAGDPAQVQAWVEKVLAAEAGWLSAAERPIRVISDTQEQQFAQEAQDFLSAFQPPFTAQRLPVEPGQSAFPDLKSMLQNESVFMLTYFGHGSIDTWGKDRILTGADIEDLKRQKSYPVVVNMTCLTGYYVHPQQLSLTESLLFQRLGGSPLVLAPTSLTMPTHQANLLSRFTAAIQSPDNKRAGDVFLELWQSMNTSDPGTLEVMQTFSIFGDPATVLFP